MKEFRRLWCSLVVVAVAGACSSPTEQTGCGLEGKFGISLTVMDSVTGLPPANVSAVAQDGAFTSSAEGSAPPGSGGTRILILNLAGERAGTYDLSVTANGYRDWSRNGVVVTADACHVITVPITVRLVKIPT